MNVWADGKCHNESVQQLLQQKLIFNDYIKILRIETFEHRSLNVSR